MTDLPNPPPEPGETEPTRAASTEVPPANSATDAPQEVSTPAAAAASPSAAGGDALDGELRFDRAPNAPSVFDEKMERGDRMIIDDPWPGVPGAMSFERALVLMRAGHRMRHVGSMHDDQWMTVKTVAGVPCIVMPMPETPPPDDSDSWVMVA